MPLPVPAEIDSPSLCIRLVRESDLPALLGVNRDPAVTQFLPYATWQSLADADAWFKRMAELQATGTALQFVVVSKATQCAIGTCLLFRFDEGSARAELGYVLGRPHWGRGVMREALTGLLGSAFGALSLRRIEAEVNPANEASRRLLLGLGFQREGLLRERWMPHGRATDVEVFGLLAREWSASAAP